MLDIDGEMPSDDFIFRSNGLECNGNLSVLHHEGRHSISRARFSISPTASHKKA